MEGTHSIAGEMRYLTNQFDYSIEKEELAWTPEGALEMTTKFSSALIACFDPEAIIVFFDMLPNLEELRNELSKNFQEEFIPDLIKVDDVEDYMFAGGILYAAGK